MSLSAKGSAKSVRMHETQNDSKSNAKNVSMETLQARLVDGIDLALAIKQAHWNLKGPQFIAIHLMLDGFRDEMDEYNDTVAERITQLGGTARGTTQAVASETKLTAYPLDVYAIADHLAATVPMRHATHTWSRWRTPSFGAPRAASCERYIPTTRSF